MDEQNKTKQNPVVKTAQVQHFFDSSKEKVIRTQS